MESLNFKNGKFRILQVSDPQDLHYPRRAMIKMLNKAYDKYKPDLVVFTGDNVLGNHLLDARFGNGQSAHGKQATLERYKKALDVIIMPLVKRNIKFTFIFGNHDDMNCLTKKEIIDLYRRYPNLVGLSSTYGNGSIGTYNLPIYSDGKIKYNLWFMDTAWHDKAQNKCRTGVQKAAVDWYKAKNQQLGGVPSLMFQHIPMPETVNATEACNEDDDCAIKANDGFIRLKKNVVIGGRLYEPTPGYEENNGQFNALKESGNLQAVVYGHHHRNNFDIVLDSVRMIQTPCASFRCYGNTQRGVRLFEIDESTASFTHKHYSYFDICGKNPLSALLYFFSADEFERYSRLTYGALIATVVAEAVKILVKMLIKC